jgi:alkylhydroperoxidase family enzyme
LVRLGSRFGAPNLRRAEITGGSCETPTLRFRRFDEIPPADQEHVAFLRARMRAREDINGIFGAQAHWPVYTAANHKQALASYQFQGVLPQLANEAMHVAISMTNGCDF